AVGVAAGFVAYGPKDHPIRVWAAKNGIWPPNANAVDVSPQLDGARVALERDTKDSRVQALNILSKLHAKQPSDPVIASWRAFTGAVAARSEQRWIADIQASQDPDAARMVEAKRAGTTRLVNQAGDWLRPAQSAAPARREILLAEAAVALAQGKTDLAQRALTKVATADAKHRTDPLWLHLSAATIASKADPGREGLRQAQDRLRTAVAARPSLLRAQVLLARLLHRQGREDEARRLLRKVIEREPAHEESSRLLAAWAPPPKRIQRRPPPPQVAAKPKTRVRKVSFDSLIRRADILRERDRATAALALYEQAAKMRPNAAAPLIGKGWCLLDLGEAEAALIEFLAVQQQDPNNAEAYYGLAETHREVGNKTKALDAYSAYLARSPANNPERRAVERQMDALKNKK
ncbi:MAG: tetratricopeptide repeat protein, partial [Myxococcota bacterium]